MHNSTARRSFFSLIFLIISTISAASAESFKIAPNLESIFLKNGLQVVVIPDRRAPVVTHMVWYRVGSADELPGKSGVAHYLEHLMFKGTPNHPEGEFSKLIAKLGGQENAFTSYDYTAYFQRVAKEHLGTMMEYEADRMVNLILSPQIIGAERNVILEERASRTDSNPSARLGETVSSVLYSQNPYGIPIIGWESEIKNLTHEDAIEFYHQHYHPANAILIVAGDTNMASVKALAEKTYGKIPPAIKPSKRVRQTVARAYGDRSVTVRHHQVNQPNIRITTLTPSYATATKKDAEALDIFMEIIAGGTTSRLYQEMVISSKIASSVGGWYRGSALGQGQITLYAVPRDEHSLDDMRAAIKEVVSQVIKDGITEKELETARNRLVSSSIYAQDSQQSLARVFGTALTTGQTIADVQEWPQRVQTVSKENVIEVAKKYLTFDQAVTGYLRPKAPGKEPS